MGTQSAWAFCCVLRVPVLDMVDAVSSCLSFFPDQHISSVSTFAMLLQAKCARLTQATVVFALSCPTEATQGANSGFSGHSTLSASAPWRSTEAPPLDDGAKSVAGHVLLVPTSPARARTVLYPQLHRMVQVLSQPGLPGFDATACGVWHLCGLEVLGWSVCTQGCSQWLYFHQHS